MQRRAFITLLGIAIAWPAVPNTMQLLADEVIE
jgi:hypothetical protein